jgi:hypothetical protein
MAHANQPSICATQTGVFATDLLQVHKLKQITQRQAVLQSADTEPHRIVGMTYSAPARTPVGQRAVIVFRRV